MVGGGGGHGSVVVVLREGGRALEVSARATETNNNASTCAAVDGLGSLEEICARSVVLRVWMTTTTAVLGAHLTCE